ncbi:kelch-like protein 30 [Sarcoramphus papa]
MQLRLQGWCSGHPLLLLLAYLQHLQNLLGTEPLVRDSDASKALVARARATGQSDAGARKNPPTPPQKLEEVLVVVGGRVLEEGEDEDRGLEMPAAPRNFAFYNPKSSLPSQEFKAHHH